ncbi:MAG: SDR family oxidoreductase [Chloroflexi bacterium]|nr:SDR family oxidoreductase [Chloroflexota bacterium]MYD48236.1 SDR family oxidoreductase [Chloroflexota bacterium]
MDVSGAVFIVTGSATGLGATVAQRLAGKGGRVVVNYTRSLAEAEATADACRELGGDAILCQADVSVDEDCRRMAQAALDQWGRIDGLVNNAATSVIVPHHDLEGLSSDDFRRVLDVNVVGAFQMARAVTPAMQQHGNGAIVNVSSGSGFSGSGSSIAYAASKAALNVMTFSLARALAPEIRVNAVCPGVMQTRWWRDGLGDGYDAFIERYAESAPLKTAGTTEAVADPIVWLLESAAHVTGETILVDAGSHLGPSPRR